jgi:hypothetical protein
MQRRPCLQWRKTATIAKVKDDVVIAKLGDDRHEFQLITTHVVNLVKWELTFILCPAPIYTFLTNFGSPTIHVISRFEKGKIPGGQGCRRILEGNAHKGSAVIWEVL